MDKDRIYGHAVFQKYTAEIGIHAVGAMDQT